jgi:hypothetical protein
MTSRSAEQPTGGFASKQPYEVEDFHQKHKHLTHKQARDIVMKTKGNRAKADAEARSLKK